MTNVEIFQLVNKRNIKLSEKDYIETIEKKTAVLIKGACRTGAILSEASNEKKEMLTEYGKCLGLAFQMCI